MKKVLAIIIGVVALSKALSLEDKDLLIYKKELLMQKVDSINRKLLNLEMEDPDAEAAAAAQADADAKAEADAKAKADAKAEEEAEAAAQAEEERIAAEKAENERIAAIEKQRIEDEESAKVSDLYMIFGGVGSIAFLMGICYCKKGQTQEDSDDNKFRNLD